MSSVNLTPAQQTFLRETLALPPDAPIGEEEVGRFLEVAKQNLLVKHNEITRQIMNVEEDSLAFRRLLEGHQRSSGMMGPEDLFKATSKDVMVRINAELVRRLEGTLWAALGLPALDRTLYTEAIPSLLPMLAQGGLSSDSRQTARGVVKLVIVRLEELLSHSTPDELETAPPPEAFIEMKDAVMVAIRLLEDDKIWRRPADDPGTGIWMDPADYLRGRIKAIDRLTHAVEMPRRLMWRREALARLYRVGDRFRDPNLRHSPFRSGGATSRVALPLPLESFLRETLALPPDAPIGEEEVSRFLEVAKQRDDLDSEIVSQIEADYRAFKGLTAQERPAPQGLFGAAELADFLSGRASARAQRVVVEAVGKEALSVAIPDLRGHQTGHEIRPKVAVVMGPSGNWKPQRVELLKQLVDRMRGMVAMEGVDLVDNPEEAWLTVYWALPPFEVSPDIVFLATPDDPIRGRMLLTEFDANSVFAEDSVPLMLGLLARSVAALKGSIRDRIIGLPPWWRLDTAELNRRLYNEAVPNLHRVIEELFAVNGSLRTSGVDHELRGSWRFAPVGAVDLVVFRLLELSSPLAGGEGAKVDSQELAKMGKAVEAAVKLLMDDRIWEGEVASRQRVYALLGLGAAVRSVGSSVPWQPVTLASLQTLEEKLDINERASIPTAGYPAFRRCPDESGSWLVASNRAIGIFLDLFERGLLLPDESYDAEDEADPTGSAGEGATSRVALEGHQRSSGMMGPEDLLQAAQENMMVRISGEWERIWRKGERPLIGLAPDIFPDRTLYTEAIPSFPTILAQADLSYNDRWSETARIVVQLVIVRLEELSEELSARSAPEGPETALPSEELIEMENAVMAAIELIANNKIWANRYDNPDLCILPDPLKSPPHPFVDRSHRWLPIDRRRADAIERLHRAIAPHRRMKWRCAALVRLGSVENRFENRNPPHSLFQSGGATSPAVLPLFLGLSHYGGLDVENHRPVVLSAPESADGRIDGQIEAEQTEVEQDVAEAAIEAEDDGLTSGLLGQSHSWGIGTPASSWAAVSPARNPLVRTAVFR